MAAATYGYNRIKLTLSKPEGKGFGVRLGDASKGSMTSPSKSGIRREQTSRITSLNGAKGTVVTKVGATCKEKQERLACARSTF